MTYNPNFQWKRKTVSITTVTALTAGHQVKLTIPKETEMQSDFRDIRFETTGGIGLPHWLENIVSNTATVWVRLKDAVNASTSIDIYMYYGNPYVTSASNGTNTFDFFDDFEDGNANGWSLSIGSAFAIKTDIAKGTYSYGYGSASGRMTSPLPLSVPYILETDLYFSNVADSVVFTIQNDAGTYIAGIDVNSGEYKYWGSSMWTSSGGIVPTFNNWTTLRIIYKSTIFADYYEGGRLIKTNSAISGTPTKIAIGAYDANTRYDNIRVRKYVATEPATPTISSSSTTVNWNPQRKAITINTTSATPANYQVKLTIPFSQEMNLDFSGLRFVTKANPPVSLDYWIESFTPGVTADIWVRLADAINTSSSDYIYMHYGNPNLASISNITNTFIRIIGSDIDQPVKGAWTLDGNVIDTSGNNNNGTLSGGVGYTTGKFGQACIYGTNGYIDTGNDSSLAIPNTITVSAWAKGSLLVGKSAYSNTRLNYLLSSGEFWITTTSGTALETYYTFPVDTNWHYIVGVYDGTNQIVYVDGVQVSISNRGTVTLATTGGTYPNLHFGRYYYNGSWVYVANGSMIDEVRIYNRALTPTEITDLYNNYGYTTTNYPGRELIRKYVTTEPSFSIGTAESMNSFSYRKTLTINNNSGTSLTDYQIPITVAYSNHMQSNFNDIRFVDSNNNILPYWIESKTDSSTAYVWIKVNLPNYGSSPTGDNIVYMYYGNSSLISASDVNKTFIRVIGSITEQPVKGAWTFDNNATDNSGNGNNGTLVNSPTYTTGKFGNALNFIAASSQYVNFGQSTILDVAASNADFTYSAWVNVNSYAGTSSIISRGINSSNTYYPWTALFYNNGIVWLYMIGPGPNGTDHTASSTSIKDNSWHHIVGIRNGINGYVYIDGILRGTNPAVDNRTYGYATENTYIGANHFIGPGDTIQYYFNGLIDEPRIYNRALTPAEITDIYNNYGYTTTNYPGRELVRKFASPAPTYATGTEQTPTDITATLMTITPNETPCRHNICTVTVSVTWTNNGAIPESFVPNIAIDTVPIFPAPYPSEELAPSASVIKSFVISGLAVGTRNICPSPN